jgi:hypothetical protein
MTTARTGGVSATQRVAASPAAKSQSAGVCSAQPGATLRVARA